MVRARFDDLLRSFASGLSRRATLAALANGVFGAVALALMDDAAARKRRKRKKKRKRHCASGTKPCGKNCIPVTSCCSSPDCGPNGTCVGNRCNCNSGFKGCNGACIANDACCGACPGDRACIDGVCACPGNAPFECPGDDLCFAERPECCDTATCPGDKVCVDGRCLCREVGAIDCVETCCDGAAEVCKVELEGGEIVRSCQPGSCPATDICVEGETERFFCAQDRERICLCTSTVDLIPGRVCVDFFSLGDESCEACDTSSDCGTGRVCVADGPVCGCGVNYCVRVCPEATGNSAKRGAGGTPVDREAFRGGLQKRHRSP